MNRRLIGVLITGTGVMVLSPDTLVIRLLDTDLATTLFYRGLAMGLGLFAFLALRDRGLGPTRRTLAQPLGWGLALMFAISNIGFVTTLTTGAAVIGHDMQNAANLAVEHLGGKAGDPLRAPGLPTG